MNNVAVVPYIGMHALQIQNVKRNVVKKVSVDDINEELLRPPDVATSHDSQEETSHNNQGDPLAVVNE